MREQVGMAERQPAFSELLNDPVSNVENEYYQQWLSDHHHVIDGLKTALVNIPIDGVLVTAATLNNQSPYFAPLVSLSDTQATSQQPQVATLEAGQNGEMFALVYPLRDQDNDLIALIAMAIEVKSQAELQKVLTAVQWSSAGLEVVEYQRRLEIEKNQQSGIAERVDILARVLAEPNYSSAAVRLVTELAVLFNCDRVSLGEYKNHRSRLKHLSHSTQFGKRMNLVRTIEQTMDECIDQGECIRFPQSDGSHDEGSHQEVVLAHRKLSEHQGDACVMSIPVYIGGQTKGALVLEGNPDVPWTSEQAELGQSIASMVFPALEDKRLNDRFLLRKILDSGARQLGRLLGVGYLGRKLFVICLIGLGWFLYTAVGTYRLSADARIESATQRAIVTPYDGYIKEAYVRAGDHVKAGQLLVSMDDKDLRLERLKWLSEKSKLNRQYQEALAVRDRAKINIINAQTDQVQAQLELVNSQLARGEISAPFDGLVVSGDLSQRLGSVVSKGESLLEVAPVDSYRIRMLIKENRIADVKLNQTGNLYLSALPEFSFKFELSKITPLTESLDGSTYFVVEGILEQSQTQGDGASVVALLQPGMEGVGKIVVDDRLLVEIWTRETLEWLRLRIWTWWG
ncbi:efflux RND transporter periplasmic adaptor subunit [Vibrio algarum]|uniref:Efflux RND transporter periplasmic adaptor subunit n=1 Tax=Vibrio algarum TaxID=3020714 RepID=A0ABT4YX16_9VIBR|nr:efflux RND transporter periplasmic adaptor subunit [Vibrio sp. KJ40-1]MDB1126129.1 efflux RND transporter periplasmic adaptor subunit [Vibrio sp. KJ40-1]